MRFKKVLLIDDDDIDLYVSKRILKSYSFSEVIITTNSVKDALEYITNNISNSPPPEIIFLDLNMPGENGLDFLNAFEIISKEHKLSCNIALLINVVDSNDKETAQAKSHPMVKYVFEKPLTEDKLKKISFQ